MSVAVKSAIDLHAAGARLSQARARLGQAPAGLTGLAKRALPWTRKHHAATTVVVVLGTALAAGAIIMAAPAQPGGAKPVGRYLTTGAAGYDPARPPYPVRAPLPMPPSYAGVYEPAGSTGGYAPVDTDSGASDKLPKIAINYGGWFQGFNTIFADSARTSGAIPFIQIEPRDVSLAAISRGAYDSYLRAYADAVAGYQGAVIIGFGQEMNERRYSWGDQKTSAAVFVLAWRHIVSVFRSQNADNVTWIWTIGKGSATSGPIQDWWPGASYVTWVGIDGYYQMPAHSHTSPFAAAVADVRHVTDDPVLLFGDDKPES